MTMMPDDHDARVREGDTHTGQYWKLRPVPKYESFGVERGVHPRETIRRVRPLMSRMGVTRLGEVTHLDRVGIPNYMTVRPREKGQGISYYNGKGSTKEQAAAGALMEAVERYSGESCDSPVIIASYTELEKMGDAAIRLSDVVVPTTQPVDPDLHLEWVRGYDLIRRQATLVPLNCVVCPYESSQYPAMFYASTNGLASGNTLEDALAHALCEVVERDAMALAATAIDLSPVVDELLAKIQQPDPGHRRAWRQADHPLIAHHALPTRSFRLLSKLVRAGLDVFLRSINSPVGVPTIDCTIVENVPGTGYSIHGGCGTHPDARIALMRALCEAAQSRVACIQGGREDLPEFIQPPVDSDPRDSLGRGTVVEFESLPSFQNDCVDEDIEFVLQRMGSAGLDSAVAFDLTRPELGIPVVRVVVPRAEAWTVFRLHTGRGVFGSRVESILREGS